MYTPKAFKVEDLAIIHATMRQHPLATLVTLTPQGLVATHLPLMLDETRGEYGTLIGHISRANLQGRNSDPTLEALAIFTGPETYVTPNWYPSKQETGRAVPTWYYAAIHAYGKPSFFDDPEHLRQIVTRLTDQHEAAFPAPWKISDAPRTYIDSQLKAIIGVELPITRIEGKQKFDQNSPAADRAGVIAGLRSLNDPCKTEVADLMTNIESKLTPKP
ncbi:FMN-binding negative transcriptional regulator [Granulicella arctica]|uniref:Transcriptional regulator n=1 Tax=Granulicella arctica TaxID=940613 RepID=A0A7Y9PEK2_9BACT|nr:FMN-binding negative transcriptional regulator [Granulicella arctica]NYF78362.1 transcriptional regulator [Granulicella arctica]